MTIHHSHPFEPPRGERDAARRFRGRLGGAVSLWTAGASEQRAGLTVSSLMLARGEPARVLALLDPDADLTDRLRSTARGVVQLLQWQHRGLADAFAGTAPAPGGPWRRASWLDTPYGPRLDGSAGWLHVRLEECHEVGWSLQVTCVVDEVGLVDDVAGLGHRHGRYVRLDDN